MVFVNIIASNLCRYVKAFQGHFKGSKMLRPIWNLDAFFGGLEEDEDVARSDAEIEYDEAIVRDDKQLKSFNTWLPRDVADLIAARLRVDDAKR